ncbi:hypothetical protein [Neisseria sicca]|nr:hypothetical protein [Neisseria sicca]
MLSGWICESRLKTYEHGFQTTFFIEKLLTIFLENCCQKTETRG